jgi:hypothetical protein
MKLKTSDLFDTAITRNEASERLQETWRKSDFHKYLVENLKSKKLRIYEPPTINNEEFIFNSIDLKNFVLYAYDNNFMRLSIDINYYSDEFQYNERKFERYFLIVPTKLIKNTTKTGFNEWAKQTRKHNLEKECIELEKKLNILKKKMI